MAGSIFNKIIKMFLILVGLSVIYPAYAVKIGISMPNIDRPRFSLDAEYLTQELESHEFDVEVKYADRTAVQQIKDIDSLLDSDCKVLIITPVDAYSLKGVLEKARTRNIPIIAYDRLIMDSKAVSYYATFDNYKVGQLMAQYLIEKLNLKAMATNTKNIEFFSGDIKDNNSTYLWNGALDTLKPYIDNGKLEVLSGENELKTTYIDNWENYKASLRMNKLIDTIGYGPDETKPQLDAVLCHNDGLALGVTEALINHGYTRKTMPLITGQDCQKENVLNIKKRIQAMSIFKDSRVLAYNVSQMVLQILNNETVQVNDTTSFNNGTGIIPTRLCSPKIVEKDNIRDLLIESGFYTPEDLK